VEAAEFVQEAAPVLATATTRTLDFNPSPLSTGTTAPTNSRRFLGSVGFFEVQLYGTCP